MKLDQTTVYMIIAAVVVGIYLGGSVVMTLIKILSRNLPQQQPYYPPHYDGSHTDYNGQERGWGCWTYLFLLAIGGMILMKAADSQFVRELLNKDKGNSEVINSPVETTESRYSVIMSNNGNGTKASENRTQHEAEYKPAASVAPVEAADPHIVRVAAFSNYESALAKMQKLTNQGLRSGYYLTSDNRGNELFAVFTGAYRSKADALDVKGAIGERGAFVVEAEGLELYYFEE